MGKIPSFAFEKLRGFKPSQFGPFCAKCVCTSASLLPPCSLGCESQRLEVSGPGGCKVFEKACGGRGRGESRFLLRPVIFTRNRRILHKAGNVLENVINIRVLFSPLSPPVFSHFSFCLCFFSSTASFNPF